MTAYFWTLIFDDPLITLIFKGFGKVIQGLQPTERKQSFEAFNVFLFLPSSFIEYVNEIVTMCISFKHHKIFIIIIDLQID
jgi:hypothetical protein